MEQTVTQQHTPGHAPLPWTVDYQGRVSQIDPVILDANGAEVVKAWTLSAPHPTDNAAYIVRAVNSHDDLLAAAGLALAMLMIEARAHHKRGEPEKAEPVEGAIRVIEAAARCASGED